jgi:hypothetical protein
MNRFKTILSPCVFSLTFCLIALAFSLVGLIKGETFADIGVFFYLSLSIIIFSMDVLTKKITKHRKVFYWILQTALLIGLFLLTRLIVGDVFSMA